MSTHAPPAFHLAPLLEAARSQLGPLSDAQRLALQALIGCRTGAFGERVLRCDACTYTLHSPRSCGHRSCPRCQHAAAAVWLARQQRKLLPVTYYMATFTLPEGLRTLALHHPTRIYDATFKAAADTLTSFGQRHRHLKADLGFCAVLHTHSRRLDFHPHLHVVIPGGGIDRARRQWRTLRGRYLFNGRHLATVFRAKCLAALKTAAIDIPVGLPKRWIVHCTHVGSGLPAVKYLSRYLYRGVIDERQIVAVDHDVGTVTFRYQDSKSKTTAHRTLTLADFARLLLRHVLPTGYRRVRDYGFLNSTAKRVIAVLQYVLRVVVRAATPASPRPFLCPHCQAPMRVIGSTARSRVT